MPDLKEPTRNLLVARTFDACETYPALHFRSVMSCVRTLARMQGVKKILYHNVINLKQAKALLSGISRS